MNENCGERHSLILQNCRSLSISGVTDADSFDEKKIRVFTECGELCIYGEDDSNKLDTLDISNCSLLETLFCGNNNLSALDISNCPLVNAP